MATGLTVTAGVTATTTIKPLDYDNTVLSKTTPNLAHYTNTLVNQTLWNRNDLSRRDRSLVTVAALVAMGKSEQISAPVTYGLQHGLTPTELNETLLQLAFYCGWPNVLPAVRVLERIYQQRQIIPAADGDEKSLILDATAEAARLKVVNDTVRPYVPGLADDTDQILFGELWRRPQLTPRDRSLVTMAALLAMGQAQQLGYHLNRAMDNGLTAKEAGGVVSHLAYYIGWPRAFSAVTVVRDVQQKRATPSK
ncbi:carboxymuconolactone decarboxylase family protein [Shewanella yunxiaonensis]|uniref:Carboxymuconolactone decarboxylase family protein n=1 Tax=Shewanella yunxiaonensis TaxID=2829809 RepID=A0ABX7YRD0_9GAMM|nr:carboxymuconolactone decarboxylase family protein [Shewanella yunxiaonensis]QUN05174.1 carboxymuconolactone decarboxylase family protein [Shewanella yunxiaonensis]